LVAILCVWLNGCNHRRSNTPLITFSKIPPSDQGGPNKLETIEGHVTGARPGQQIVLFAKAGPWWVQPMANQPFTKISPDSNWKNLTHLGTEYAALLVDQSYRPHATMDALPVAGGEIAAVATVKGVMGDSPPAKAVSETIQFSGYPWKVRSNPGEYTGALHNYDPANISVDAKGFLHLRVTRQADRWICSEVQLANSFGYGTYVITVEDVAHLEPAAVLSFFTWDELGADQYHRELDIQLSRWGDPANKNAQYVLQPYYVPQNVSRFAVPSGLITHFIRWEPGEVTFHTIRGNMTVPETVAIARHVFRTGIPTPGSESLRINMCAFEYAKVSLQTGAEAVIERVQYLP
jgi:hypothetical protein